MNIRRTLMAMGVVAGVACLPMFGTTGAIVSPTSGTVAVNGQPVAAGSAIVAGDLVSTSTAGSARMVLPGGSLIAGSNTNFRMESVKGATQIRLSNGLVEVSGFLPVALSTRTVVPSSSNARFNVYDLSGKVYVETVAGKVAVKSAKGSVTVPAGKSVEFNDSSAAYQATAGASMLGPILSGTSAVLGVVSTVMATKAKTAANNAMASADAATAAANAATAAANAATAEATKACDANVVSTSCLL